MLNAETIISRAPEAIDVRVGGTLVLHEPDSGHYVKLNPSAAELWDSLQEPVSFGELNAQFAARRGIGIERVEGDVRMALEHLIARELVRVILPGAEASTG